VKKRTIYFEQKYNHNTQDNTITGNKHGSYRKNNSKWSRGIRWNGGEL